MTIEPTLPIESAKLQPRIVVMGVGGAGGNAVNNMINSNLEGVECMVANTDAQSLSLSLAERKVQLGMSLTQGLGAGARPEIGRAAAEEGIDEIIQHLQGCHMVFLTAGMGGGTGTGATPVLARAAREQGILTVGVVTKPFHFEGVQRMHLADQGIDELEQVVDTLIVIPNQNLFRIANEHTTFADAFKMADDVLYSGVRGVTDLMVMPGLINLDFADIRTVMSEMGKAMMGAGEADGENRAVAAAEAAISNPLLDDISMKGARGVLINITGGSDMTLYEVDEAANRIRDEVDPNANIIFGSTFDDGMQGQVRVSVFATGINSELAAEPKPITIRVVSQDGRLTSPTVTKPTAAQSDMFGAGAKAAVPTPPASGTATQPAIEAPKISAQSAAQSAAPAVAAPTAPSTPTVDRVEPRFGPAPARATPPRSGGFLASATAAVAKAISPAPAKAAKDKATVEESVFDGSGEAADFLDDDGPGFGDVTVDVSVDVPGDVPVEALGSEISEPTAETPAPVTAMTTEPNEEDLLEIPAFLRRQAN
jgi:cell division protein FtsZ